MKLAKEGFSVTLIEGKNVSESNFKDRDNLKYFRNPPNIASLMNNADFAISNGGSSMLEFFMSW